MEKIIIAILIGVIVTVVWWKIRIYRATTKFRKNVTIGDVCYFYINEDKEVGEVVAVSTHYVVVNDIFGFNHRLNKSDIYPVAV